MVQELPGKKEADDQEKQSLKSRLTEESSLDSFRLSANLDASSQSLLLARALEKAPGKLDLPELALQGKAQTKLPTKSEAGSKPSDAAVPELTVKLEPAAKTEPGGKPETASFPPGPAAKPDLSAKPEQGLEAALKSAEDQKEQLNENGSKVSFNTDGSLSSLTRKDGSKVELSYKSGQKSEIIDYNKDQTSRTVWTQKANKNWQAASQVKDKDGNWISDGKAKSEYRDINISEQGVTIARDLVGFMHVTTADGKRLEEGARYTFDEKGRVESISYMPSENRSLKFHYDQNNEINKVEFRDVDGKLQQTKTRTADGQWQVTNANGTSGGIWKGDLKLADDGKFLQRNEADRAAGQWQVISSFSTYTERISQDGKHISRVYSDRALEFEKTDSGEERISKITRGSDSREFRYDADGKLAELIDKTIRGSESTKTDGMDARIFPSGDVVLTRPDGSVLFKKSEFASQEWDRDGNLIKVVSRDGSSRSFEYETINNRKQVVRINDTRIDKNGPVTQVWTAKRNADGSLNGQFATAGAGGKEQIISGVKVLYNGDFKYRSSDGKERSARIGRELSREGALSSTVEDARERLKSSLDGIFDEKRKVRLEKLMNEMEKRAQDAIERQTIAGNNPERTREKWEKKIAQTYDNLAEMMESNPATAVYDRATRAKLVENFMWIASDTTRGAQDVGNCWQMSGRNLTGMQNNPEAMSRILKDVSLSGSFTAVRGGIKQRNSLDRRQGNLDTAKRFAIPKSLLQIDKVNAGWSLDKPDDNYWRGGIGTMPSTPVGYILDNVIGYMGGRKSHSALDGGLWESFASPSSRTREGWYYGINELMYMATGEKTSRPIRLSSNSISDGDIRNLTDKRLQRQLLEHGGALLVGPGHMFAVKLVKNRGEWQIVTDNQWGKGSDQVIGRITDLRNWNVQRTRTRYKSEFTA